MVFHSPSGANGARIDTLEAPTPGTPAKTVPRALTIRNWPLAERPREKLLERGAQALSDAELLALLLGSGTRGRSAVELARALIADFGSLRSLLAADGPQALARAGVGPARYAVMQA